MRDVRERDVRERLAANFARLAAWLEAVLAAGQVPLVFLDFDDTMNARFGGLIEAPVVAALRDVAAAGVVLGLNTGADISWAGERILSETDRHFPFPFMLLATGRQIYAWVEALRAYALLPISAESKGRAMRALASHFGIPLAHFAFVGDFPGPGDLQEGIDDSVLREPIGLALNVGGLRPPEELSCAYETMLLHPPHRQQRIGCGHEATALYLACLGEALTRAGMAERACALRDELLRAVERRVGIQPVSSSQPARLWTFEERPREVPRGQPIRIRTRSQGLVHAGVSADGRWLRVYDVPLRAVARDQWEADLLDPDVNEFTFIWFDPARAGRVKWEGRNYAVRRTRWESSPATTHDAAALTAR